MEIQVDFDVFKALTAMRRAENHTYNDVLRELLGISISCSESTKSTEKTPNPEVTHIDGLHSRGLFLPEDTRLKAVYKGREYYARVKDGAIINKAGKTFTSPSGAASSITETTVNGWRFWQAKRPNDADWYRLDQLP
ncbi:hypothetical protein ACR9YC_11590 [Parasphingorhabdus sp. DH2-15]|uniref:hypothetical protein n=1 Tax=Parasphingorhabdus sp. DH2-15 TaxID=3444112 RepID=UPI003F682F74